jgi:hypothetical protein
MGACLHLPENECEDVLLILATYICAGLSIRNIKRHVKVQISKHQTKLHICHLALKDNL